MSSNSTMIRSMHDLGLAAWFGGSLMGAVGLNGATGQARDPQERTRLSSLGWARWTPVQVAAVGIHTIGGLGLIADNKKRLAADAGTAANTKVKLGLTVAAAGVTLYSGVLGGKVARMQEEGAEGATEPSRTADSELASAQKQLKALQWAIPALTGVLIVLAAQQGEQQRDARGLLDKLRR
ncbi:hypothetical protein [Ornithinimicrobium sediminis]|uniref:hypothetical protein n=1 Tax=Ornithinimicrobium sediminis TaxID=2904603 RepID=UPI001E51685C|nr:hypothetical protein [Ornithinimicrobium sediminis]MCE0488211.1 hypothetical protein [Ornithinimicrobium sediminis]